MPRTRVVIQSRLSSSRLPGKALLTLAGMPLIELVARRASRSGHEVVVATSVERYDSQISEHLESVFISVLRGPLDDVLGRFDLATADLEPDDLVVRLTGDNPVADADLVDELVQAVSSSPFDYGRVDMDRVPEGLGAEVFSVASLRRAATAATAPYDREHVTPWLRRELGEMLFVPSDSPADIHAYRCTVDCLDDYDRVSRVFAGRTDPVGVPWRELLTDLGGRLAAEGPTVPRRGSGLASESVLVLGGAALGGPLDQPGAVPSAHEVRELLALAVQHGVSHVEVGRNDPRGEAMVRAGTEPALAQRLGVWSRMASLASVVSSATVVPSASPVPSAADVVSPGVVTARTEAGIERTMATLGRRRLAALVLPSVGDAELAHGAAWAVVRQYLEAGEVERVGVALSRPDDLPRAQHLEGLGALEVTLDEGHPWADPQAQQTLRSLSRSGVRIWAHVPLQRHGPDLGALGAALNRLGPTDLTLGAARAHDWVDAVIVGVTSVASLRTVLDALDRHR